jgi:hypothetical protein
MSMTRAGAIDPLGGADVRSDAGASTTVRMRSMAPSRLGLPDSLPGRSWPHVMQKRMPRWFALPQSGHVTVGHALFVCPTGTVGSVAPGSRRLVNMTSGAGGRAFAGGAWCGPGATTGDAAVSASGEVGGDVPADVADRATRGASLWPHS